MALLLDSHAFVWWAREDTLLSTSARSAIENTDQVFVSVATAWEIAIKVGKGKWPEAALIVDEFETTLADHVFDVMPITVADVRCAGMTLSQHRDPFDKLLAAQALNRDIALVTSDRFMASLGARTIW